MCVLRFVKNADLIFCLREQWCNPALRTVPIGEAAAEIYLLCGRRRPFRRPRRGLCMLRHLMLKAVIFDIDGTLIDSVDLHAQSWLETFERFGVQASFADVRRHIGEGADRLIPAFVPPEMPDGLRRQTEEFRSDLFKKEYLCKVQPFPKVKELFTHIKAKCCKLVLASSCSDNEIDLRLLLVSQT